MYNTNGFDILWSGYARALEWSNSSMGSILLHISVDNALTFRVTATRWWYVHQQVSELVALVHECYTMFRKKPFLEQGYNIVRRIRYSKIEMQPLGKSFFPFLRECFTNENVFVSFGICKRCANALLGNVPIVAGDPSIILYPRFPYRFIGKLFSLHLFTFN